jgi:hypothetical protein
LTQDGVLLQFLQDNAGNLVYNTSFGGMDMGVAGTSRSSSHYQPVRLPNPNPSNYKILQALQVDGFLILKIHYPDCTNFEGQKILVFQDTTAVDLLNQRVIDPHFSQDKKNKSPIARFVPTDDGWGMAQAFVGAMRGR